ncbi:MAG TPA: hypothetical protein PL009_12260 [Flavipsychrobacter sp.]|nr:hypothetical protein [Flavipsychrobacter sp.]
MASLFSLNIPFCVLAGKSIVQGSASGSVLTPYQVYEVRLQDGTIFNLEAIPFGRRYHWYSIEGKELASGIGREIENYFSELKKRHKEVCILH